jgi:hypothetical protein
MTGTLWKKSTYSSNQAKIISYLILALNIVMKVTGTLWKKFAYTSKQVF